MHARCDDLCAHPSLSLRVSPSLCPCVQEHNFAGVLAWLMGGLSHVARLCLMFDVSAAHGQSIGGGAIFLLLSGAMIILVYFFLAYRSSLSATVAAVSAAVMSIFLSAALFHASSLNHVAPGSAIGAAVGLWLYALLVYPMMCLRPLQNYVWMMEGANIVVWTSVLCDTQQRGSTASERRMGQQHRSLVLVLRCALSLCCVPQMATGVLFCLRQLRRLIARKRARFSLSFRLGILPRSKLEESTRIPTEFELLLFAWPLAVVV